MAFYRRLGELLLAAGTSTQEELDRGLALQKEQKGRLGEVLTRNGIITEKDDFYTGVDIVFEKE